MKENAIKCIAIDLDGTLLNDEHELSEGNARAIGRAVAEGITVILATARPPRATLKVYQKLNLSTVTINYNGSLIHHPPSRSHRRHRPILGQLAAAITREAFKHAPEVVLSAEILDQWYTHRVEPRYPTQTSVHFQPDYLGPVDTFIHQPITKLQFLLAPERLGPLEHHLLSVFKDQIAVAISDRYLLQIMAKDVSKGHALGWLARSYGFDSSEILAIGDAPNDIPLFEASGVSVAVGNAWEEVKQRATIVGPTHNQDAVAWAINRFTLA